MTEQVTRAGKRPPRLAAWVRRQRRPIPVTEKVSANVPFNTEFLRGRPRFVLPGAEAIGPNERPPFGCVLLIWERTYA